MEEQINPLSTAASNAVGDWRRAPRQHYPREFKRMLVERASMPGVSVAALAREYDLNANLLRIWIGKSHASQRTQIVSAPSASAHGSSLTSPFVKVVPPQSAAAKPGCATAHARLPNGVEIELRHLDVESLSTWLTTLHNLPCSASTTA